MLAPTYKHDFTRFKPIIFELKAVREIAAEHKAQVIKYLKVTGMKLGLLAHSGGYLKQQSSDSHLALVESPINSLTTTGMTYTNEQMFDEEAALARCGGPCLERKMHSADEAAVPFVLAPLQLLETFLLGAPYRPTRICLRSTA